MKDKKVFSHSKAKVLAIVFAIFFVLTLSMAITPKGFSMDNLTLSTIFSTLFSLVVIYYGFGQEIEIKDSKIKFYSNLGSKFLEREKEGLPINEVLEVRLGTPRINKSMRTYSAVNISSKDKEVTFNPDLFNDSTLKDLFLELKLLNPNIVFDKYSSNIMGIGKDGGVFFKSVFAKFLDKYFGPKV